MKNYCLFFITAFVLFSCSKKDSGGSSNPVPVVIPDTLTTGWVKSTPITGVDNISDVFFTNTTLGFAVTQNGIYKSTDGGVAWVAFNANSNAYNIGGLGNKFCFVGADNTINYTTDANNYFTQSFFLANQTTASPLGFRDCFISSPNIFYACSGRYIYKSINGGTSFDSVFVFPEGNISNALFFTSDLNGWLLRTNGLYKTTDGGLSWVLNLSVTGASYLAGIDFISPSIGIIGYNGSVYKTTDGGVNWIPIFSTTQQGLVDVDIISASEMYVSNDTKIYKSVDGGNSWTTVLTTAQNGIVEVHFINSTTGWACGRNGAIYRYKL